MADNPDVQVSPSIVQAAHFVAPFIAWQRVERLAQRC
jgi:hypothetical protein